MPAKSEVDAMNLDQEILARISAARAWDKDAQLTDFQLKVTTNRAVLVHLKTGLSQLIYEDEQQTCDLEEA